MINAHFGEKKQAVKAKVNNTNGKSFVRQWKSCSEAEKYLWFVLFNESLVIIRKGFNVKKILVSEKDWIEDLLTLRESLSLSRLNRRK
jgi:hypothetical protein